MSQFIFRKSVENYRRDINPVGGYIEDMSFYISRTTGCTLDYAREFVKNNIKASGKLPLHNPKTIYAERDNYEDRVEKEGTLLQYLQETIRSNHILTPTLTTYVPPSERESVSRQAILTGIISRSKKKKAKFVHEQLRNQYDKVKDKANSQKEHFLFLLNDALEKVEKIRNNSYSGAYISKSTPLNNRSAHAVLTSTCRSTSGYGNSNNEKIIAGNRHYFHPNLVIDNLITISRLTDLKIVEHVIEKYRLHYPSADDVLKVILYSAKLYWNPKINKEWVTKIYELAKKLTPLERAAFCYVSDLYHIRQFNEPFVRMFLGKLSAKVTDLVTNHTEAKDIVKQAPESFVYLAMSICADVTTGVPSIKNLEGDPKYLIVASTVKNITDTLTEYMDFIHAFFVTENMPVSMAHFPESMRRIALVSDTDSTIFTVQEWVNWFTGTHDVSPISNALDSTIIFLTSETITHILAKMSKNMGIEDSMLFDIKMKNEFKFLTFTPTQIAKHYFANIIIQEGNVYEKTKTEIKGVGLKTIKIPAEILNDATALMNEVMEAVSQNKKLKLATILKRIADMERNVQASLLRGDTRFFRASRIADKSAYALPPEQSPYQHFTFWNEVFAPSYSICPPPPFQVINAKLNLNSPTKIKQWAETFEDRALADRFMNYIQRNNKKMFNTFVIPRPMLDIHGLPKECLEHLKIRELVQRASEIYYLIMDSLGVHLKNDKITRLFMDEY